MNNSAFKQFFSSSSYQNFHRTFFTNARSSFKSKFNYTRYDNPFTNFRRNFSSRFKNFTNWYGEMLEQHPYKTQMVTSGILGGAGDYTTQILEHKWDREEGKEAKPWDLRRLAAVTAFGIFGMGPMGHVWYEYLDAFTTRYCRTKWSMITVKVCGDTFLFGPICLWLFFASVSVMEGIEWEKIKRKMWRDFVPTYIVDYSIWPLVQGINFKFVPVRHQLLTVNTVCYFDDIFLSYVQHNGVPKIFQVVEDWWEDYIRDDIIRMDAEEAAEEAAEQAKLAAQKALTQKSS